MSKAHELAELPPPSNGSAARQRKRHTFRSGAVYDGQWFGNKRDGFGAMTWPDGARYLGEWTADMACGHGRFTHEDGDRYTGLWHNNRAHGLGVYVHREGTTYSGQFVADWQHGLGTEEWPDGSKFIGNFLRGRKNGHGLYAWADGSQYAGRWLENQIHGAGTYIGADKRTFRGYWRESMMHGCGQYRWADGRVYEGEYQWDQKSGFAIFTWADKRRYEGFWHAGRQHGIGRLCGPGGEARLALWEKGDRVQWLEDSPSKRGHTSYGSELGDTPTMPEKDSPGTQSSAAANARSLPTTPVVPAVVKATFADSGCRDRPSPGGGASDPADGANGVAITSCDDHDGGSGRDGSMHADAGNLSATTSAIADATGAGAGASYSQADTAADADAAEADVSIGPATAADADVPGCADGAQSSTGDRDQVFGPTVPSASAEYAARDVSASVDPTSAVSAGTGDVEFVNDQVVELEAASVPQGARADSEAATGDAATEGNAAGAAPGAGASVGAGESTSRFREVRSPDERAAE